jgi:trk system potassium uptake protein TrkA
MNIVILGCGRTGSYLAKKMVMEGHQVSVVDSNRTSFALLGPDFAGELILGTGIDEDVLIRAGIENADAFVAVTNHENTNLMAAQVAKYTFQVPRAICRVEDPARQEIYRNLGLEIICHTIWEVAKVDEILAQDK